MLPTQCGWRVSRLFFQNLSILNDVPFEYHLKHNIKFYYELLGGPKYYRRTLTKRTNNKMEICLSIIRNLSRSFLDLVIESLKLLL